MNRPPLYTNKTTAERYQALYLDYLNNYLTIGLFAEHRGMLESDARMAIDQGKLTHEVICKLRQDSQYTVKYLRMGTGMHNYQAFYNGDLIAYAFTEDGAYAACAEYHINYLVLG